MTNTLAYYNFKNIYRIAPQTRQTLKDGTEGATTFVRTTFVLTTFVLTTFALTTFVLKSFALTIAQTHFF